MTDEEAVQLEPQAEESLEEGNTSPQIQLLTFTLGDEEYGVDIMRVKEIRAWSDTTRLPNAVKYMRGVINLRGLVVPIFDLRMRFGMEKTEAHKKNVVIIIRLPERVIGILVDTVSDILNLQENDISPAPAMETGIDSAFVNGIVSVQERMVVLLELEKMFDQSTLKSADQVVKS